MEWRGRWVRVPDIPFPSADVDAHPRVGVFINKEWSDALLSLVQHADQAKAWENADQDQVENQAYKLYRAIRRAKGMIGAIVPYATQTPPPGTLACDGSEYLRADYPDLYAALDSRYQIPAGIFNPEDKFITPDFRGRFILAAQQSGDYAPFTEAGEAEHTLTENEMPNHAHTYEQVNFNLDLEAPGAPDILGAGTPLLPTQTSAVGGGQAHNNMPPFIALNYAIVCY